MHSDHPSVAHPARTPTRRTACLASIDDFLFSAVFLASGRGFGIPTMVLHILVLLVAFDRTQPGKLAADFLAKWNDADFEGAKLYLEEEWPGPELSAVDGRMGLLDYFCKQLIYRSFEKMFVMFFWYIIAGPYGVLFSYVSYQLRDSHDEKQAAGLVKPGTFFRTSRRNDLQRSKLGKTGVHARGVQPK